MEELFEPDWGEDNSPEDNTEIKQVLFYYSKEEAELFKKLCKAGMRKEFPSDFMNRNSCDLVLHVLKKLYGDSTLQTVDDRSGSGEAQGVLSLGE